MVYDFLYVCIIVVKMWRYMVSFVNSLYGDELCIFRSSWEQFMYFAKQRVGQLVGEWLPNHLNTVMKLSYQCYFLWDIEDEKCNLFLDVLFLILFPRLFLLNCQNCIWGLIWLCPRITRYKGYFLFQFLPYEKYSCEYRLRSLLLVASNHLTDLWNVANGIVHCRHK